MSKIKTIKEEIKLMDAILTSLQAQIADIHSEGDVEEEITTQVQAAVAPAIASAVAPFQQQITDLENSLTAVVTALNNPNPNVTAVANTASQAVTASQAATATNVAAVGAGTAPAAGAQGSGS